MKRRGEQHPLHANLACSFCGKRQAEVKRLIAGPMIYICDECVRLCVDILADEIDREPSTPGPDAPPPVWALAADARKVALMLRADPRVPLDLVERATAVADELEALGKSPAQP